MEDGNEIMRTIIGYRRNGKIYGFTINLQKYGETLRLFKLMTSLGAKFMKDYIRLQGGNRMREFSTDINKLPQSVKRMWIYENGGITEDNLVIRRVLMENNPLNQLSDEEKEILKRIQNGEK